MLCAKKAKFATFFRNNLGHLYECPEDIFHKKNKIDMLNRVYALAAFWLLVGMSGLQAQDDPTLFKVNDTEVKVSEFTYIYDKTNGKKADYSEASLKEYLDLYINFKLQVAEGVSTGLNDDPQVKKEQNQYKSQLAKTYLIDREITEKLVREAYDRSTEDRKISHILVAIQPTADENTQRQAYERAKKIKSELTKQNFNKLAKQYSDDQYSRGNEGLLGYFTALQLPYELETAAYTTKVGEFSDIVKTKYGYHIVRVDDIRPAYGRVKTGHILARTNKNATRAKVIIDSLYEELKNGAKFEDLAAKHSQDNTTKNKGGQLGWIGINKYGQDFEQAMFALDKDNGFSAPIKTSSGWHIIKRYQAIKNPTYQEVKSEITNKIKRKPRFNIIQQALVDEIKKEGNYKENQKNIDALVASLGPDFITYKWKMPKEMLDNTNTLFTVGNVKGTVREFASMAQRANPERLNEQPRTVKAAVTRIINKLATQKCLAYEETQLDKKYPEFKALMREYEEGILLFEVKKQLVWDKASSDKEGLEKFYGENKDKYKWKERANVTFYTIRSGDEKLVKKIKRKAKCKTPEKLKAMFNEDREIVQSTSGIYEKGKNIEVDKMKWKKRTVSEGYAKDNSTYFTKIEEIISPTIKTLDEARGYVVADYQDHLEKELIKSLKEKYKITINEDVLKTLVK